MIKSAEELADCRNEDINFCTKDNLVDLKSVMVDTKLTIAERIDSYMIQVKNPYLFRVGETAVKIEFNGSRELSDCLIGIMISG